MYTVSGYEFKREITKNSLRKLISNVLNTRAVLN